MSRDPIGYLVGPNLYGYVSSQPTIAVDPSGLWESIPGYPEIDDLLEGEEGSDSFCDSLEALMRQVQQELQDRWGDMYQDPGGLYGSPGYPNHQTFYGRLQQYLRELAGLADLFCKPPPEEVKEWIVEPAPDKPYWAECRRPNFGTEPCFACHPFDPSRPPQFGNGTPLQLGLPNCKQVVVGVIAIGLVCTPWPDEVAAAVILPKVVPKLLPAF